MSAGCPIPPPRRSLDAPKETLNLPCMRCFYINNTLHHIETTTLFEGKPQGLTPILLDPNSSALCGWKVNSPLFHLFHARVRSSFYQMSPNRAFLRRLNAKPARPRASSQ